MWLGRLSLILTGLLSVVLWSSVAGQGDSDDSRRSLVGLLGVRVTVDSIDSDAQRAGLFPSQIQTDVELKLRQAGIRVLTDSQAGQMLSDPYLYVRVDVTKREGGVYIYLVSLDLVQAVYLKGPALRTVLAQTWSVAFYGVTGESDMADRMRGTVRDETDRFMNAYLAVNQNR
jgi:hypothetical protein